MFTYGSKLGKVMAPDYESCSFSSDLSVPNSLITFVNVGTSLSLKFSTLFGSNGTQMFPVFGWTQNGDLSKWLMLVDTLASSLGYKY